MNRNLLTITGSVLVGAVVGALLLTVLRPPPLPPPPILTTSPNCATSGIHCIKVFLYGNKNKVQVNSPHLYKTGQSQTIFWLLDNSADPSYTFLSDGIVFTDPDGKAEFSCALVSAQVFSCLDANGVAADDDQEGFKYKVTVTDTAGKKKSQDPHVINY